MKGVSIGAGRMGRGIALAFALAGHDAALLDAKVRDRAGEAATRKAAFDEIEANLAAFVDAGGLPASEADGVLSRIGFYSLAEAEAACAGAAVAFEGVPEVMEAKREAFAAIAHALPAQTILASTSSTFLSTDVARLVERPERFLNAHWLNPAFVVPLVEVSPHPGTDPAVTAELQTLLRAIGKVPVLCGAAPGYIVPRLQSLLMNEAARMIEEGVATAADIDLATRHGLGFRFANMGVVEFIDFGGNDILFYASAYLAKALGSDRYGSPEIIARHMSEQRNGLRDGRGFYDWADRDLAAYRRGVLAGMVAQQRKLDGDAQRTT